ncbi:oligosaccharide flippase family protein [Niallia circulans]|uniref:oligosaccharide flippase family protein n=1 Tax=Niallia circulans TaxID=1397 RepID=UPI003D95AC64
MTKNNLFKNTLIYGIATFTSKLINFLLLPIITFYVAASEFGRFDYYNSFVAVLVPLISLQISDAAFRFLLEENDLKSKKEIVTNSIFGVTLNILLAYIFCFLTLYIIDGFNKEVFLWIILVTANIIFVHLQNLSRGFSQNKEFALSGVINSISLGLLNILFLIIFKMEYIGLVTSNIVALVISIIYLYLKCEINKYLSIKLFNFNIYKKMLLYSIPLIPNFISWWIINLSDRILINFYLGTEANGVYAVAYRFTNMLMFAITVFNKAWQESAILTFNKKDTNTYYTSIFNKYYVFLFSSVLILIPFFGMLFNFIDKSYAKSLYLIPILLYAVVFSAFSSFFGTAFQSSKNTREAVSSSILAGILNIIFNIILIPYIGLIGASISTLISFIFMCIYRILQTQKYFTISYNYLKIVMIFIISIVLNVIFYNAENNIFVYLFMLIFGVITFVLFNKSFLNGVIGNLMRKNKKIYKSRN